MKSMKGYGFLVWGVVTGFLAAFSFGGFPSRGNSETYMLTCLFVCPSIGLVLGLLLDLFLPQTELRAKLLELLTFVLVLWLFWVVNSSGVQAVRE